MNKTPFIIILISNLLLTVAAFIVSLMLLANCDSQVTGGPALTTKEFFEECKVDREQMNGLQKEMENIEDKIDEGNESIEDKLDTIIANLNSESNKETPVTQAPSKDAKPQGTNTPTVSILYNNEFLAVPVSTTSKLTPFALTYSGEKNRDLEVTISGNISKVNLVDEKGNYLANISFQTANNLNYFYFYMDNDGNGAKFYFEIVTTAGQQYYFGINY